MNFAILWLLYNSNAPWWVWLLFVISASISEFNSLFNLIDRFKK